MILVSTSIALSGGSQAPSFGKHRTLLAEARQEAFKDAQEQLF